MSKSFVILPVIYKSASKVTLISWLKDVGDEIEEGERIIEISIDQVNSFVTSEFSGELKEKLFKIDDIIKPGEAIAEIENDQDEDEDEDEKSNTESFIEVGPNSVIKSKKLINNFNLGVLIKSKIVYFFLGGIIILSVSWFLIEWNKDSVIILEQNINIPEEKAYVTPIKEQVIISPTKEIVENRKEKITTIEKTKNSPIPKENKTTIKKAKEAVEEELEIPFDIVDEAPIFPGCERVAMSERRKCFQEEINAHIRRNFRYPEIAQEMGVQGRVYVNFIISEDGSITNIRLRGPDKNLEKEAKRIISKLPKMTPGKQKGRPVRVPFSVPISFRLQ